MAHYAKLGFNNVVLSVIGIYNESITDANGNEDEGLGQIEAQRITGWDKTYWKKTSYNTRAGKYYNADGTEGDQSKAFRKNYAEVGGTYDETRDAFLPPKPYASWVIDETTCQWVAPQTKPEGDAALFYTDEGGVKRSRVMQWNESNQRWEAGLWMATEASLYWDGSAWQDI